MTWTRPLLHLRMVRRKLLIVLALHVHASLLSNADTWGTKHIIVPIIIALSLSVLSTKGPSQCSHPLFNSYLLDGNTLT